MRKNCLEKDTKGFTLIELLVVILIIAILAAIALPQYQKAVEKNRAVQAITLLKSLAQAEEAFYLINGSYTRNVHELDLDISWSGSEQWATNMTSTMSNGDWAFHTNLSVPGGPGASLETISLGRLTGPWAGGGFVYVLNQQKEGVSVKPGLYCAEHFNHGKILSGADGSYCQKLFNRAYSLTIFGDTRLYRM